MKTQANTPAPAAPFPMPGSMDVTPAAALLATVAAPFAAAGVSDYDALRRAYFLVMKADGFLNKAESVEFHASFRLTLEQITDPKASDRVGSEKSVRSYLFAVWPKAEAEALWAKARAGEKCFTFEDRSRLISERARRFAESRREARGNN